MDMEHKRWNMEKTCEKDTERRSNITRYLPPWSKKKIEMERDVRSKERPMRNNYGAKSERREGSFRS